jgi:hypothetical protein
MVFGVVGRGFGIEGAKAKEGPTSREGVLSSTFLRKRPLGPRSLCFFRFFWFLAGI